MMKTRALIAIAGLCLSPSVQAAAPAVPADISLIAENGTLIPRTSGDAMPIYTYDSDTAGKPTCTGPCAAQWPPVVATPHSEPLGDWSMIPLPDGNSQWAYKNRPLYKHASDTAGKPSGDGMGGAWHLLPSIPEDQPK